jgi:hypothetical protein
MRAIDNMVARSIIFDSILRKSGHLDSTLMSLREPDNPKSGFQILRFQCNILNNDCWIIVVALVPSFQPA